MIVSLFPLPVSTTRSAPVRHLTLPSDYCELRLGLHDHRISGEGQLLGRPSSGLELGHATTDVGRGMGWWAGAPLWLEGRAPVVRETEEPTHTHTHTHTKCSPGDAGEVSYYNLEKQTPVNSCFFFGGGRRKGGRDGPKGSCTRPSSSAACRPHPQKKGSYDRPPSASCIFVS